MGSDPYREVRTMTYTEHVYYDATGAEVGRERMYDDTLQDFDWETISAEELEEHRG